MCFSKPWETLHQEYFAISEFTIISVPSHFEAETKLPLFRKRHFQMYLISQVDHQK